MCRLEPGLPGGTFPSCARLRRQQTAHTLVFRIGDGFLGFSVSCSQPAPRSQIVICNHFWPHRQRQQPARAAAALHMGLAAPPPAPAAGHGGCSQQRGWGGTWPCPSSSPALCPCSAVPSVQRSRNPNRDGGGNLTAGGRNGHKSKSALTKAPAGSEPDRPPRGGTPGTVLASRGLHGVGPP